MLFSHLAFVFFVVHNFGDIDSTKGPVISSMTALPQYLLEIGEAGEKQCCFKVLLRPSAIEFAYMQMPRK